MPIGTQYKWSRTVRSSRNRGSSHSTMAAIISAVVRCQPMSGVRPPDQMASGRRAISEWVCREISRGLADQPSVKIKRPIPNFF